MRYMASRVSTAVLVCILSGCAIAETWAADALAERLNAEASVQNAKVKIAFDPARESIITVSAPDLVRDYRLNYAQREDVTKVGRPEQYESFRIVRYPGCNKVRPEGDFSYLLNPTGKPGICSLHIFAEAPPPASLRTEIQRRTVEVEGHKISRVDMTIKRPDGRTVVLVFYPGRSDLSSMAAPQIASALNLRPRGDDVSDVPAPDEVDRLITLATTQAGKIKYAWLDDLAQRDPASNQNLHAARFAPAEIAKRGEALTRRFEQMAPQAAGARYWNLIGESLALLPQQDWVRYRDRLAAALIRAPREQVVAQKKLIFRMSDMGVGAVPVLLRASGDGIVSNEIAIAACRIGAPIAPQFGQTLLASWQRRNSPQLMDFDSRRGLGRRGRGNIWRRQVWEHCTAEGKKYGPPDDITFSACWAIPETNSEASATYLALRRMGLGKEADAMARHQYSIHWKQTYAAIGPSSPAGICGKSEGM